MVKVTSLLMRLKVHLGSVLESELKGRELLKVASEGCCCQQWTIFKQNLFIYMYM